MSLAGEEGRGEAEEEIWCRGGGETARSLEIDEGGGSVLLRLLGHGADAS